MNDQFLRHLRPVPRAAFVHDLKARLDRLPRKRALVSGPAYLRTLLVALLIGGAAFAVTMLSTRRAPVVARMSAPVPQAPPRAAEVKEATPPSSPAQTEEDEIRPVAAHAVRRDSSPVVIQFVSGTPERAANGANTTSSASGIEQTPATPLPSGIAIAGDGIRAITGAGSEYLSEIISGWAGQYRPLSGLFVSYDPTSGPEDGVKMLLNKAVTFAAVDIARPAEEIKAGGLMQFPVLVTGVVPVAHLSGVLASQIRLDGRTLARIYLGEISHWNDPEIGKLNPKLSLPNTRITLMYRLDTSVTTYVFTDYLSKSEPLFDGRYGVKGRIDVSPGMAARGNEGMMDLIQRTDGAIGYIDYSYARRKGVDSIRLFNREGNAVAPTPESLRSAMTHADWAGLPVYSASLTDLRGERTWPITSANFVIVAGQLNRANRSRTAATVQFFDWAYRNGSKAAEDLGYVSVPPAVANRVRATWAAAFSNGAPADSERK